MPLSFLDSVLEMLPEWETSPASHVFVLPSKRAGFFLRDRMAKRARRTMLAPEIWSIEDFIEHISGLRYASDPHLLFRLYEAYLDQGVIEKESFDDFAKWGMLLLQDFNELDRYLVDAESLFQTLANLQQIRNWAPDGHSTPMIERRLAFWRALYPIYIRFREGLLAEGLGYQGMLYRLAQERLETFLKDRGKQQFIFMGFNALNTAESLIIRQFLQAGNTRVYWDADPHYVENPIHDAGLFLRRHLAEWPELAGKLPGMNPHFREPRNIRLVGLPKAVSQAKYCGELLADLAKSDPGSLDRTALVLGDESLLNPILHSLPESIGSANVTMGYPLQASQPAQLFELLLDLRLRKGSSGWSIQGVLNLLSHPFLQPWFRKEGYRTGKARAELIRENIFFVARAEWEKIGIPEKVRQLLFPDGNPSPVEQIAHFTQLIAALREAYLSEKDRLNQEYLFRFDRLFNQLQGLCAAYPFVSDLRALQTLFRQLLAEEKLDFEGQPLEGLQIMGMLESRNLDFETVIITSVNEGILPSGKSNNSFIPYDVKREFGLPTYKEKDAVYAYHFYRLLQRARNIYICYNTEPDALEGGEPSRFISQLRTDPLLAPRIENLIAAPEVGAGRFPLREVPKNEALLLRLRELAESGFSPTSLGRYIQDPMEFYRKNVLGIPDSDELEETVAANTFGTVLHQALEDLYRPLVGRDLTPDILAKAKKEAPGHVQRAFEEWYLKGSQARGRNLIALQVLIQYVELFLDQEIDALRRQTIRIVGVEQKLKFALTVPSLEFPVYLKGTIDRIEEVNGELRIIDYKTGLVQPGQLRIPDWESLRQAPERAKALQLLCYAWLFARHTPGRELKAGVISFKNLGEGRQWFGLKLDARHQEEHLGSQALELFHEQLTLLLREVFDPQIPFRASEDRRVI